MMSFGQFALVMGRAARETPHAIHGALVVLTDSVALEAKGYIGHELPSWAPLAARTVREKRQLGYVGRLSPTDPLLRSGELRHSISASVSGYVGVVGSPLKKALWQEMGTLRPSGSIPPRPFLGLAMSRARPQAELFFGRAAVILLTTGGRRGA